MEETETDTKEAILYAKAIISYFALYFPEEVQEKALILSSNSNNYIIDKSKIFVEHLTSKNPFDAIVSLVGTYQNDASEKDGLDDIRLVQIFDLLFSEELGITVRASLISTFRVLIKSYFDYFKNDTQFKDYIKNSYRLFCDANHSNSRINWFSDVCIGAYTQMIDLHNPSNDTDSCEKSNNIPPCYCKKIKWNPPFVDKMRNELFLERIYDKLKNLSSPGERLEFHSILRFPKTEAIEATWKEITINGESQSVMLICSKENFINMFEGITKAEPIRTIIGGAGVSLSKFIDSFVGFKGGALMSGSRTNLESQLGALIVDDNGTPYKKSTLEKNLRNPPIGECYNQIIKDAYREIDDLTNK